MAEETRREEPGDRSANLELLRRLKSEAFDGSDSELALALGRPAGELHAWFSGDEEIDEDAEMKIQNLAEERLDN